VLIVDDYELTLKLLTDYFNIKVILFSQLGWERQHLSWLANTGPTCFSWRLSYPIFLEQK
jgi:hypothetical protein